jgi:predicted ribosomally synthesized peptide with nif11-like leader
MVEANLKAFLLEVVKDPALQEKLKSIGDKATFTSTLLALGKEKGYEFSAADVDVLYDSKVNPLQAELSDAELAMVSGGAIKQAPDGGTQLPQYTTSGACTEKSTSSSCGSTSLFGWCS